MTFNLMAKLFYFFLNLAIFSYNFVIKNRLSPAKTTLGKRRQKLNLILVFTFNVKLLKFAKIGYCMVQGGDHVTCLRKYCFTDNGSAHDFKRYQLLFRYVFQTSVILYRSCTRESNSDSNFPTLLLHFFSFCGCSNEQINDDTMLTHIYWKVVYH